MAIRLRGAGWLMIAALMAVSAGTARAEQVASVTFRQAAPKTGEVASHSVATRMTMDVSVHLGQQLVHQDATRVERGQHRVVRLTRVEDGRSLACEVTYRKAEELVATGAGEEQAGQQAVAGKTYRIERRGEMLWISDAQGLVPPLEEYEIVWSNMESFGKASPLAAFLVGRTVAVGQTLDLPAEAAMQLLSFGDDVVEVERFALSLAQVQASGGGLEAVFGAMVTSRSHGRGQMGMQVDGTLVVDAATCRVRSLELAGPIGLTETRTNGPETYLVSGRGKIEVAMRSQ